MSQSESNQDDLIAKLIVEKEQATRQPPRFYNQDSAFGIMATSFVLLELLFADFWRAEIGLRFHFSSVLLGTSILLVLFGIFIVLHWRMGLLSAGLSAGLAGIAALGIAFSGARARNVIDAISSGIVVIFAIWLWARIRTLHFSPTTLQYSAVTTIAFAAIVAGGWGAVLNMFSDEFLADDEELGNHRYYLVSHPGWLGDPGWIELHQCNKKGRSCDQIYTSPMGYYEYTDVVLDIDLATNTINVAVNGEILYTHTP